jgi:site-specific DNA-cytosine methylase
MKVIDLFAGCGGFSLGFENAGFKTCPAVDKALFPYDGHTGADIIKRLLHV